IYPFARTTAGACQFPENGGERERPAQRYAQRAASLDRFVGESDQVAEHRRNAGRGYPGWIRLFNDEAEARGIMKARQLAIVLFALVVLGGIALVLRSRNATSWRETATVTKGKVLNFSLNDASHLAIKSGADELNLVKKGEIWTVAERFDYPADFTQVANL